MSSWEPTWAFWRPSSASLNVLLFIPLGAGVALASGPSVSRALIEHWLGVDLSTVHNPPHGTKAPMAAGFGAAKRSG